MMCFAPENWQASYQLDLVRKPKELRLFKTKLK